MPVWTRADTHKTVSVKPTLRVSQEVAGRGRGLGLACFGLICQEGRSIPSLLRKCGVGEEITGLVENTSPQGRAQAGTLLSVCALHNS